MNITRYIFTSDKLQGQLILTFKAGIIWTMINEFKGMNEDQHRQLMVQLPFVETKLHNLTDIGLKMKKDQATNQKIALFCKWYEKQIGIKYKITKKETGMIGNVEVNDDLLAAYFTNSHWKWNDCRSVSNYCGNYNLVRSLVYGKQQHLHQFPNQYSADFEKSLSAEKLPQYWAHLRALGWQPIKRGNYTTWKEPINPSHNG